MNAETGLKLKIIKPGKVEVQGLHAVAGINVPGFEHSILVIGKYQSLVDPDLYIIESSLVPN